MTYEDNQIASGKKWDTILKKFKALEIQKEYEWIESQVSIMKDIEVYKLSVDPEADVSWSSKSKKELRDAADEAKLSYDDNSTKDDLIVLLENKSDGV